MYRAPATQFCYVSMSRLAKEEQKDGLCAYGCNDVPPRSAAGRPRKLGP